MKKTNKRPSNYNTRTYIQKSVITNRRIRKGDISRIAEKTGYSIGHVSDVISGKEFCSKIMNGAFDMVRGRKENVDLI